MRSPVEGEISDVILAEGASKTEHAAEQRRWGMLASFDEGGVYVDGVVYWMMRRDDLAAGRFEAVVLGFQR
ncbi:hypothetical protein ACWC4D_40420 [Streptomyces sp. NPDC001288]|uniref:hypothetical protein n=1 Tax=Streptomyces sp. NPDC001297 TaxID=3364559 RepID=UPI0036847F83